MAKSKAQIRKEMAKAAAKKARAAARKKGLETTITTGGGIRLFVADATISERRVVAKTGDNAGEEFLFHDINGVNAVDMEPLTAPVQIPGVWVEKVKELIENHGVVALCHYREMKWHDTATKRSGVNYKCGGVSDLNESEFWEEVEEEQEAPGSTEDTGDIDIVYSDKASWGQAQP
jgi:hypothetical protein